MTYPNDYASMIGPDTSIADLCEKLLQDKKSIPFSIMVVRITTGANLYEAKNIIRSDKNWKKYFDFHEIDPRVTEFLQSF